MRRFLATPIAEALTPLAVGIALLLIIAIAVDHIAFPVAPAAPKVGYTSAFIPSPRAFCLTNVQGIVSSQFWNESALVGNTPPVEDSDYQFLPYVSERFCLPGDVRDHYVYDGAVDIPGSGWVEEWSIGNGGRIALLHLQSIIVGLPGVERVTPCPKVPNDGLDHTADCLPPALPRAVGTSSYHGGQYVGSSGWPSQFAFSNNSCNSDAWCAQVDPHFCLTGNAAGIAYLQMIARRGPLPPPFPVAAWNAYRSGHRLSLISPYYHGTLSWQASVWLSHRSLLGIRSAPQWHATAGYSLTLFSRGRMWCWPKYHRCKVIRI